MITSVSPLPTALPTGTPVNASRVRLSDVQYVARTMLRENPINAIFRRESVQYFREMEDDIRQRGIIDALIAKPDGTLLSGHNRLRIAASLELEAVPVRYMLDSLDDKGEREFLIKDNLLRRHFTAAEKIRLYEHLYENFHERRQRAIDYGKKLSEGVAVQPPDDMLTIEQIARETGQSPAKVKAELYRYYKKEAEISSVKNGNGNNGKTLNGNTNAKDAEKSSPANGKQENTPFVNTTQSEPFSEDAIVHNIQAYATHLTRMLADYHNNLPYRRKVAMLLRELGNRIESNQY